MALLQETRDPRPWADDLWSSVVWRPMPGPPGLRRTLWGSAVIARSLRLEEYEPGDAYPWLRALGGSVAVARWAGQPAWLASVHAQASPVPQELLDLHPWADVPLCAPDGSVWEQDLIPFELHRLFGDETFLWGGDLNSAEIMDDVGFLGGSRQLRRTWRAAGSCDLRRRFYEDEQQTFLRVTRRRLPSGEHRIMRYQLDHAFADAETERRVVDWRVDTGLATATPAFSDHAPILIELK